MRIQNTALFITPNFEWIMAFFSRGKFVGLGSGTTLSYKTFHNLNRAKISSKRKKNRCQTINYESNKQIQCNCGHTRLLTVAINFGDSNSTMGAWKYVHDMYIHSINKRKVSMIFTTEINCLAYTMRVVKWQNDIMAMRRSILFSKYLFISISMLTYQWLKSGHRCHHRHKTFHTELRHKYMSIQVWKASPVTHTHTHTSS